MFRGWPEFLFTGDGDAVARAVAGRQSRGTGRSLAEWGKEELAGAGARRRARGTAGEALRRRRPELAPVAELGGEGETVGGGAAVSGGACSQAAGRDRWASGALGGLPGPAAG